MSLSVKNITKIYGEQRAVDDISFEINSGEVVGFLGPNGAGKSTTMKMATCFIPPSEGTITVAGFDIYTQSMDVRKSVGYLPEHNPLYLDMFVHEYLGFIGGLHGLRGGKLRGRVMDMVEVCGLTVEQSKKIGALSKGYRQRVGLAQAIIHDPQVLILDEPTTGLDPNQIVEIRSLIKELGKEKTVVFSTHIMQEVQALCDRAIIINRGKIVADGRLTDLVSAKNNIIQVSFDEEVNIDVISQIEGVKMVEQKEKATYVIHIKDEMDIRSELLKCAASNNWNLQEMKMESSDLESVFRELTKGANV